MVIHFVCRGNAFRSVIAEAYLNSLEINGVSVMSSGTVAEKNKVHNSATYPVVLALLDKHGIKKFAKTHYADQLTQTLLDTSDIIVCANQVVYDECVESFKLPRGVVVWNVADMGEPGRMPKTELEREAYFEDAYQEIVKNVDALVRAHKLIVSR